MGKINDKRIRLFTDISLLKDMNSKERLDFFTLFEKEFTVIMIAEYNEISKSDLNLYGRRRNSLSDIRGHNEEISAGIYLLYHGNASIPFSNDSSASYITYTFNSGKDTLTNQIYKDLISSKKDLLIIQEALESKKKKEEKLRVFQKEREKAKSEIYHLRLEIKDLKYRLHQKIELLKNAKARVKNLDSLINYQS